MYCEGKIYFTPELIEYLKTSLYENTNEVVGDLGIFKIEENIYNMTKGKTLNVGTDDKVSKINAPFSFHTHPRNAYHKYDVTRGIPSNWDYLVFATSYCDKNNSMLFHIVVAIEGLYVISFSKDSCDKIKKIDQKLNDFIMDNYGEIPRKNLNIQNYCTRMCDIKYKGDRLFDVTFIDWKDINNTCFEINYKKVNNTCDLVVINKTQ